MGYDGARADEKLRPLKLRRKGDGLHLNDETFPHHHDFNMSWIVLMSGPNVSYEIEQQPDPEREKDGKATVHLELVNASAEYQVVVPWKNTNIQLWSGTLVDEEYTASSGGSKRG